MTYTTPQNQTLPLPRPPFGPQAQNAQFGYEPQYIPQYGYDAQPQLSPPGPNRGSKLAAGLVAGAVAAAITYFAVSQFDKSKPATGHGASSSSSSVILDPPLPPLNPPVTSPPVIPPVSSPPITPPPVVPDSGWPPIVAPFARLVGTGAGTSDAWNGASCGIDQTTDSSVAIAIRCDEPDGTILKLVDFTSSQAVTGLVSAATAKGASVKTWNHNGGPVLGEAVIWPNDPPEVATTFAAFPSFVVEIYGGTSLDTVQSDWANAPFPTS